jgi:ribosome maturation protein Sdo1
MDPELGRDTPLNNYLSHRTVFAFVPKGTAAQTQENYVIFV